MRYNRAKRNKDEIAKYIAELTHSEIKKLCVQCGKSPDFIGKYEVKEAVCSAQIRTMLRKFAKISHTKIVVKEKAESIYEYFANYLCSKIGVKYEMIKALEMRKCESKMAINAQQRKLCKIYLQKAKMQSVLEIISSEKSNNA